MSLVSYYAQNSVGTWMRRRALLRKTYVVDVLRKASAAKAKGIAMIPRSAGDKEYFPQDWFVDRLKSLKVPFKQLGRNTYPDFWVGTDPCEGFEIKSLAFTKGRPARADYDCNSSIPSGRVDSRDVFLAFFLYTGTGDQPRRVHSLSIAHGDLINSDHALADAHANSAVRQFGSYGDGFIRDRKMYRFPNPFTLDPAGIGRCRLIVPSSWDLSANKLRKVGSIKRTVFSTEVAGYSVNLRASGKFTVKRVPYPNAGTVLSFDLFEAK